MTTMHEVSQAIDAKKPEGRPEIETGDTIDVHVRIVEGEKERIQIFNGTVIAMRRTGTNASVTVRRLGANSEGVERVFPLYSPRVEKFVVKRHGVVRRSKLYFLRDRVGKSTRLAERRAESKK